MRWCERSVSKIITHLLLDSNESFMALELEDGSLERITGTVVYSKEFFE